MGFVNEELENYERQTIDRERGIVLKREGNPGYSNDWRFHLTCLDEGFYFRACRKINQVKEGYHIEWIILQIFAPDHVKQDKAKLHGLITEAMDAYGFSASKENVLSVVVTFSPNL